MALLENKVFWYVVATVLGIALIFLYACLFKHESKWRNYEDKYETDNEE